MNETIIKALKDEQYKILIMAMPDTYVDYIDNTLLNNMIYDNKINIGAYLWEIRKSQLGKIGQCSINENYITNIIDKDETCNYKYGWGVIIFKKEFEKYILDVDEHPGYSMKNYIKDELKILYKICDGNYFDCGTIGGYKEYLLLH